MKVRTLEELCQKVDNELSWRRVELSAFRSAVEQSAGATQKALLRAGVALLYAHWEGFVKQAAALYVTYVASCRQVHEQLRPCFLGLTLRKQFAAVYQSPKASVYSQMAEFAIAQLSESPQSGIETAIRTDSNLTSAVMRELTMAIGIDNAPYELKGELIDRNLVGRRNGVAHGEYIDVDVETFDELYTEVWAMLDSFRDQVQNAAQQKSYLCVR